MIDIKNIGLTHCQLDDIITGQGIENVDIKELFAALGLLFSNCGFQVPISLSDEMDTENTGHGTFTDLSQQFLKKRMAEIEEKLINDRSATYQDFKYYLLYKGVYDFFINGNWGYLYEGYTSDTEESLFKEWKKEFCKDLSKSVYHKNAFVNLDNLMTFCGDDFKIKPFISKVLL